MLDVKDLVEQYIDFLKTNITYKQVEKGFEITTPFLDEKNDWIQIYISEVTLTNGFNEYNIVTIPKKDFGSETCNKYFIA